MQTIEYGVSLSYRKKQERGWGDVYIPVTSYYSGRRNGEVYEGKEYEAIRMTQQCAEQLAAYLPKITKYSCAVIKLTGDGVGVADSLEALGEAVSLESLAQLIRQCAAQQIYTREQILEVCSDAVNQ